MELMTVGLAGMVMVVSILTVCLGGRCARPGTSLMPWQR